LKNAAVFTKIMNMTKVKYLNFIVILGIFHIFIFSLYCSENNGDSSKSPNLTIAPILGEKPKYNPDIPKPETIIGFPIGEKPVTVQQIEMCLKAWTKAAPEKSKMVQYATSHEGRPLYYIIISAPQNIKQLDSIKSTMNQIANPVNITESEVNKTIQKTPAPIWLAYTIHGTETEGSDAALLVIYNLIALENNVIKDLLNNLVIIIDPVMNPDGRDRFVKMVFENRGKVPNFDAGDLTHTGYWPQGRGNHYLFDLNRDWMYCVHPETQGRVRAFNEWNPVFLMDAHGMGAYDTHLFSPPREPLNPFFPQTRSKWHNIFAGNLARAFDKYSYLYYTGEWHEEWFPGYTDAYSSMRGTVGVLHEQSSIAIDGIKRPEGRILTYEESVFHHVIASFANIFTAGSNRIDLLKNLYNIRKQAVENTAEEKLFAVLPTKNESRISNFINTLLLHGIKVYESEKEFSVISATDQLGREHKDFVIPKGTILISTRQPLGNLVLAMLEFDPKMSKMALEAERKEILSKRRSRIYDTTAWNLTMMYDLKTVTVRTNLPETVSEVSIENIKKKGNNKDKITENMTACIVDGADDNSVAFAAKLLEEGFKVRNAEKDFVINNQFFTRGSIVVTKLDNRKNYQMVFEKCKEIANNLGLKLHFTDTAFAPGDSPDLGGRQFRLLEYPRIAIFGREGFSAPEFGSIWFTIDKYLQIRHSRVDVDENPDLYKYNVIILPGGVFEWSSDRITTLKEWVKSGGTLIAIGNSVLPIISEKADFSKVRNLPETFSRIFDYELRILQELLSVSEPSPKEEILWATKLTPSTSFPWQITDSPIPDEKELKRRDEWLSMFMPQGAILAARIDTNHWLTAGCDDYLPVMAGKQPILMAADNVEAPIRYGYIVKCEIKQNPQEDKKPKAEDPALSKDKQRIGWCASIPDADVYLRMSGLLWNEAGHRLAHSAYVTRESYGRGQIILFATSPTFRGATRGTMRVFLNAVIYGPAYGTTISVLP
jgi:hypothetical protein